VPLSCALLVAAAPLPERRIKVRMVISPGAAGLDVTYHLSESVSAFSLPVPAEALNIGGRSNAGATVEFSDGALRVSGEQKLNLFAVEFLPDTEVRDRIYPLLTRFHRDSLVVHVPSLRPDPSRYETSIEAAIPADMALLAGTTFAKSGRSRRVVRIADDTKYLYIGPSAEVADLGYAIFVGGGVSESLTRSIKSALRSSLDDYASGLAVRLPAKPVVVVAQAADARKNGYSWRGDTTDNFMFLRFDGVGWDGEEASRLKLVDAFVRHEAFHLWNGWLFREIPGQEHAWLNEGSAELASMSSALKHQSMDASDFNATMTRYLNECREILKENPLGGPLGESGRAPYACGTVVQWIASVDENRSTSIERFFALWRTTFAAAARAGHVYGAQSFLQTAVKAAPARSAALDIVSIGEGIERWTMLTPELAKLGVPISTRVSDPPVLRKRMVMHLLSQVCTGRYGFYDNDTFFKLDTGTRCPPAPVDPEVDTVEGEDIFGDAAAAYERVSRRCANGEAVELSRGKNAGSWRIECKQPLMSAAETYIASP
jgi:hypothetical protein